MFETILKTQNTTGGLHFLCLGVALLLGLMIAFTYMKTGPYTRNFVQTLVVLPILVSVVMLMINGSLGTSVAILGAFGLVRFRSMQGTSREISYIFFVMAVGLSTSTGYIVFSITYSILICIILLLMNQLNFGDKKIDEKELRITIPENLDYIGIFDEIFSQYLRSVKLIRVKTTNLGSMYELCYHIHMKEPLREKEMIDALRCLNGNLTIVCGYRDVKEEL